MGLFDDVQCDFELPHPSVQGGMFQTKSFEDPYLDKYHISEDGELRKLDKARSAWEPFKHTGELRIYHLHNHENDMKRDWYEYVFWLVDGKVKDFVDNTRLNIPTA